MKQKRKSHKTRITVMADYCADGLWINGRATDYDSLPLPKGNLNLKKRLEKWQWDYECFYQLESKRFEVDRLNNSKKFKDFILEGYLIAIEIRKALNKTKYYVEYFNDYLIKRIPINNKKQKINLFDKNEYFKIRYL